MSISRKDAFSVTSLRRLKNAYHKYLWIFKNITQKMISCDFRRAITISDEIDVGPFEILRKWNIFSTQCKIPIKFVMSISGQIAAWEFWEAKDRQSPIIGILFTTFSVFFSTDKTIYNPMSLWTVLKYRNLCKDSWKVA